MLEKKYQPSDIENRIYKKWEDAGAFRAGAGVSDDPNRESFSIVIPPPNVTGSLHMGHALNNTIQDILVRFERMRGKDVLWQPGMDHAGIATQMVVERRLAEAGQPDRRTMGREAFVEKIWEWKEESGGAIFNQLRRLGASCDWSRERFTMDEGLSEAVLKVFVQLYEDGLIYKDQRLVNWDPKLETAISDVEVEPQETQGHMWHFKYPVKGEEGRFITVATTRPETMLGDSAVAVHPDDERYSDIVGKTVILPIVGREIPIVADDYADPEKGSGAVKITPAHDFNDFEVGRRNKLEMINIFDRHACVDFGMVDTGSVPEVVYEKYQGMERFAARKAIVKEMDELGLLEKIDDHVLQVPYGDRSGVVIEPWLTDQWYVNAEELAKPAIAAVKEGEVKFVPSNWDKTYYEWMNNIQPWCISRQLWWGHQIPAWYGPDDKVFVAESEEGAIAQATDFYKKEVRILRSEVDADPSYVDIYIKRDEDVLDTWFSSGLWAFSTLGWPENTRELEKYYPTSTLVTGFDIIFYWVARMMMMSLHFMKDKDGKGVIPFETIYMHALVRDEHGKKMSKSKGNVLDPLDIIDGIDLESLVAKRTVNLMNPKDAKKIEKATRKGYQDGIIPHGTDALRFTLAAMAAQGRDIKLSLPRIEGYRNFATKLWNASRFTQMNECVRVDGFDPKTAELALNKWIAAEMQGALADVTLAIEQYKFNEAANAAYHFTWHIFCDWYLELIKPVLHEGEASARAETRAMTAWVLDQVLLMLHPFMPFITEELWEKLAEHGTDRDTMLILASWPQLEGLENAAAHEEIDWVVRLVTEVRSVRAEMNIPAGARIPMVVSQSGKETQLRLEAHGETLKWLARLDKIVVSDDIPEGAIQIVHDEAVIALPLKDVIDIGAECDRLGKQIGKADKEIMMFTKKLGNEKFVAKAPPAVVEEQKGKLAAAQELKGQLEEALKRFEDMAG